ncbi:MAG: acyl carrier protein [Clostridiaceae bacterium]|nr:acyl carrier protein [Clostridiaceae bacterium]
MKESDFVENFASQFEDVDPSVVTMETNFRNVEGWSSFTALSIIAMVDELYNVKITGNDIKNAKTVRELFNLVQERKK